MAPTRRLVLASASAGRLRLLRDAGFDPEVIVSGADETTDPGWSTAHAVGELAHRKAAAVAAALRGRALVVGCDSLLDLDGVTYGKPRDATEAVGRWRGMRGRDGVLWTGHCVIDTGTGQDAAGVAETTVRFGSPSDEEIDAYVATGEPLGVAGAFTLDGRAAPFIDGIVGDPSNVIGLSLPLLRRLLAELGVEVPDLWL
jgi:nucleoside triphosphate pyrophosphatase